MLKARNLFITLMVSYLALFVVCSIMEIITVSTTANEVMTMVRTAADMSLEQVQATDDFFVQGGGYILNDGGSLDSGHNAYKVRERTFFSL